MYISSCTLSTFFDQLIWIRLSEFLNHSGLGVIGMSQELFVVPSNLSQELLYKCVAGYVPRGHHIRSVVPNMSMYNATIKVCCWAFS